MAGPGILQYLIWQVNASLVQPRFSAFAWCRNFTALRCQEDYSVHILCRKDRSDASNVFLTWHKCI